MKRYIVYILLALVMGCSSEPLGKVSAADAIDVIKKAESTYPGVTTADAIAGLLKIMQDKGATVKVLGWSQAYRSGGIHDVWFKVKTDDSLSEFHWEISPDGSINPSNKLAQNVTKKITAK